MEFNAMHLDVLKELGNIGAGNAATSLSQLLNQRVDMNVPDVKLLELKDVPYILGGADVPVMGVTVLVEGDADAQILLLFTKESSERLIENIVAGFSPNDISQEIRESVLLEVGNIVGTTFLNALGSFTNMTFIPTVPGIANDMAGAILDSVLVTGADGNNIILIVIAEFAVKGEVIDGYLLFVPSPSSLERIFNALGVSV
ncbi:MAG: chemotaxis protein CheC [bacterium]